MADSHETRMTTPMTEPLRFHLQRDRDISGVSGTGVVALGVRWPDGTASVRWLGERPSIVFWDDMADAEAVHGHGGAARIVWTDEEQLDETDEQRADRLETERDHTDGDHRHCGMTCVAEFPADMLRNGILWQAAPGAGAMLDELLRRAAVQPPPTDRGGLRDRIANALADADGWVWAKGYDKTQSPTYQEFLRQADAVLAVLPAGADRAAVLREAADFMRDAHFRDGMTVQEIGTALCHMADDAEAAS